MHYACLVNILPAPSSGHILYQAKSINVHPTDESGPDGIMSIKVMYCIIVLFTLWTKMVTAK